MIWFTLEAWSRLPRANVTPLELTKRHRGVAPAEDGQGHGSRLAGLQIEAIPIGGVGRAGGNVAQDGAALRLGRVAAVVRGGECDKRVFQALRRRLGVVRRAVVRLDLQRGVEERGDGEGARRAGCPADDDTVGRRRAAVAGDLARNPDRLHQRVCAGGGRRGRAHQGAGRPVDLDRRLQRAAGIHQHRERLAGVEQQRVALGVTGGVDRAFQDRLVDQAALRLDLRVAREFVVAVHNRDVVGIEALEPGVRAGGRRGDDRVADGTVGVAVVDAGDRRGLRYIPVRRRERKRGRGHLALGAVGTAQRHRHVDVGAVASTTLNEALAPPSAVGQPRDRRNLDQGEVRELGRVAIGAGGRSAYQVVCGCRGVKRHVETALSRRVGHHVDRAEVAGARARD